MLGSKRYAQKEGIDYNEIFSFVVKHSSIRMLLTIAAQFNLELEFSLELEKMDVKHHFCTVRWRKRYT